MAKQIRIGRTAIALEEYAIVSNAILGIRGAGKTYLTKSIAEQMLLAKIPIIVFDPIGQWRYLRRGAKRGSRGFEIVVAGGRDPDLPLSPSNVKELIRASIAENIPLVLDLYDSKLSKADWRRIVRDAFRTLLYENKGVRHIFLEETAEFAPQKVQDGETYAEVEKLARMGGNASLGITLINQRAQEVNKAVLDLCENLVLMRQRGSHAIDALAKWLDKLAPAEAKRIAAGMPGMEQGDAYLFRGDQLKPYKVNGDDVRLRSFHPDRRRPELLKHAGRAPDISRFVTRMRDKLTDKSPPETIDALKARIKELEKQNAKSNEKVDAELRASLEALEQENLHLQQSREALRTENTQLREQVQQVRHVVETEVGTAVATRADRKEKKWGASVATAHAKDQQKMTRNMRTLVDNAAKFRASAPRSGSNVVLRAGMKKILNAIAQYPDGVTDAQLGVLTSYKATSRYSYIKQLRQEGFVVTEGKLHKATESGIEILGSDFEPLPTGNALQQHWLEKLGTNAGEGKVLEFILEAYPNVVSRAEIQKQTDYQPTSVYSFVKKLRARKLIVNVAGGFKASDHLFGR